MTNGGSLMEQFIAQEFNASVRSVLNGAIDERARSDNVLIREFEFNCFDVTLDFERGWLSCRMPFRQVLKALLSCHCQTLSLHVV